MKATKDYTSLETGKMLKNCGFESKYSYIQGYNTVGSPTNIYIGETPENEKYIGKISKAFTWQEILWEYEEKLFEGGEIIKHTQEILLMIQAKLYKKADEYFREHCILIKK